MVFQSLFNIGIILKHRFGFNSIEYHGKLNLMIFNDICDNMSLFSIDFDLIRLKINVNCTYLIMFNHFHSY